LLIDHNKYLLHQILVLQLNLYTNNLIQSIVSYNYKNNCNLIILPKLTKYSFD
jgi:hypothetical protein